MKKIVIDGQIGPWQFSKQYVREMLKGETGPVDVTISSLGGSVDHAIDIHDQFAKHGDIHVTFTGMNASSATLISLSAKTIKMSEYSFYLIHKPMDWIDEFGRMNEDDIDSLIAKIEKQKNELAKFTLVLAKMYKERTGMPINDILSLMKEETWLTAEEAKKKGFIDEVYTPSQIVNYLEDAERMAMIAASGYPVPGREKPAIAAPAPAAPQSFNEESITNKIIAKIREIFKPNISMKKQFTLVNTALKVVKLESTEEGIFLNETQLEAIETDLGRIATAETARTEAETARDSAIAARTAAETAFDAIDATVATATTPEAKVAAIKALLAAKPGVAPSGSQTNQDPAAGKSADGVDWDILNNLPHQKEANSILGQ